MSAQDAMLDRYHGLMQLNAQSHLLRAAREVGIIELLHQGQATADQIVERLGTEARLTQLVLDALVALKVLEKYGEDYALAAVTRLLCQYDRDLGDDRWSTLPDQLRGQSTGDRQQYLDAATATQWIHTSAAKQAAEILDIGGERSGRHILDYGCGSAVWSAAMAYSDPTARVTAIDAPQRMAAARRTIDSIELGERYLTIESDPDAAELPEGQFDLVLVAGRLSATPMETDAETFRRLHTALRPGGELVLIDLFRGPGGPNLNESIEALRVASGAPAGSIRDAESTRALLVESGFAGCQFAFLAASRQGYGLLVAVKNGGL